MNQPRPGVTPSFIAGYRRGVAHLSVGSRYDTPAAMASAIDPTWRRSPALDVIDREIVRLDREQRQARIDGSTPTWVGISIPPQQGKTTLASRWGPAWLVRQDYDRRVLVASYAAELALASGRWVRDLIDTHGRDAPIHGGRDVLGLAVSGRSRAGHRWEVAGHSGGMRSVGVTGGITGHPVDIGIVDDPTKDREAADSPKQRERLWLWWTDSFLPRLPPWAAVMLIQTRWHEDDLLGRVEAEDSARPEGERRWRFINIPALCEPVDVDTDPLGRQPGEWMESARGPGWVATWQRLRETSPRTFSALYQGRPAPAEGGIFKWDWIRPHRVGPGDLPVLQRVVVAVDPTGGGSDEAGVIVAGRHGSRTYVLGDRSGAYTAGDQWRKAWMAVLDFGADVLVYEANLVDPIMRRAARAAWPRMRAQAAALRDAGLLDQVEPPHTDDLARVAETTLPGTADDDIEALRAEGGATDAIVAQLVTLWPYAERILRAPESGPARIASVHATRGKRTRADTTSQAYEAGLVSHVGTLPALEHQMVTWVEGQDSPNRIDALVWAWVSLNTSAPTKTGQPAGTGPRVPTGPSQGVPRMPGL